MHDERVGLRFRETRFVQNEKLCVFIDARKHRLTLALMLDAQQMDDVRFPNRLVHVVSHAAAHLLKSFWNERGRAAKRYLCAELYQRPNVRARDAAVKDVAE